MMPLVLVIVACQALPWSQYRDHCTEMRIKMVVSSLPNACVAKAQEVIAEKREFFEDADIHRIGCERRPEA